jgi:hypothetical protein
VHVHWSGRFRARRATVALSAVLVAWAATGAEPQLQLRKDGYNLFHPVPQAQLRELETDRPDQTESPITVDAGHFQIEADLVSYLYTDQDGLKREDLSGPVLNLKAGLLDNVDLQLVLSPYNRSRVTDGTTAPEQTETFSGFGDTQVRLKVNFWGNDGGSTALAMMPFIQLPTGDEGLSSDAVEGGMIFPFGFGLPAGLDAVAMWEVDFLRNAGDRSCHADFVQSITVGRHLTGKLSGYVEFFTVVGTERSSDWVGQFDFGLNYLVHPNLKFDAGVNLGVTASAPDWNPFVGVTWRF